MVNLLLCESNYGYDYNERIFPPQGLVYKEEIFFPSALVYNKLVFFPPKACSVSHLD